MTVTRVIVGSSGDVRYLELTKAASTAGTGRFADALLIVGEGSPSDLCGFRPGQCVIDVDPEIPNGVLDRTVSEQQLDRPQVLCRLVDEGSLRPAKRVRALLV